MRRRLIALLLTLSLATLLTGCTKLLAGSSTANQDLANLAAALSSPGNKYSVTMKMSGKSVEKGVESTITGTGAVRVDGDAVSLSMDATMTEGPEKIAFGLLLVSGDLYVKPPAEAGLPADKPWVKIDPDGTDPLSTMLGGLAEEMEEMSDPLGVSEYASLGDIKILDIADETIDGVKTRRYRFLIDIKKLLDGLSPAEKRKATNKLKDVDSSEVTLWVDEHNLPVRMQERSVLGQVTEDATIDLTDWNKPVDITPPAPAQLSELPADI
jgi:hypothetical protein